MKSWPGHELWWLWCSGGQILTSESLKLFNYEIRKFKIYTMNSFHSNTSFLHSWSKFLLIQYLLVTDRSVHISLGLTGWFHHWSIGIFIEKLDLNTGIPKYSIHYMCTVYPLNVLCSPDRKLTLKGHYETPWGLKNVSNILIITVSTPTRISSWLTWSSF